MKIECVTVCVNFSDVLAHTLPLNKHHFDKIVVVTDTPDKATWRLCRHHHVQCVTTDYFYDREQAFNKANGINSGLRELSGTDWIVHMDADVVLPNRTREILQQVVRPDPDCIYGIDRMLCPDFDAWMGHVADPVAQHADEVYVVPEPFPLGARIAKLDGEGYVPIGFFQLWNAGRTGIMDYPNEHGTAGRTDMLHALRWARSRRALIPELIAIHLEGRMPHGEKNWRGRRMERFGPPPLPGQRGGSLCDVPRAPAGGGYGG